MPCYTEPDPEAEREHFNHNSEVAELLCGVMGMSSQATRDAWIRAYPQLGHWWKEHQRRDREKREQEEQSRKQSIEQEERKIRDAQRRLKKLRR